MNKKYIYAPFLFLRSIALSSLWSVYRPKLINKMNKITCINTAYEDQDIYILVVKHWFSQDLSLLLSILT